MEAKPPLDGIPRVGPKDKILPPPKGKGKVGPKAIIPTVEMMDAAMAEHFMRHDYRGMYDYYLEVIMPAILEKRA